MNHIVKISLFIILNCHFLISQSYDFKNDKFVYDIKNQPCEFNILQVFYSNEPQIIIISKNVNDNLKKYIYQTKDKLFSNAKIITDEESTKMDLSIYNIIIYGTIDNNIFLSKIMKNIPIKILNNKIISDCVDYGFDLRAIFCWSNPYNIDKSIIIYTAQQEKDIININDIKENQTQFIIAKDDKILRAGNFIKREVGFPDYFNILKSYYSGKNEYKIAENDVNFILDNIIKNVYVVYFETKNNFFPKNAEEYLNKFDEISILGSGFNSIGWSSCFRTKNINGKYIASFLTEYPDYLVNEIEKKKNFNFLKKKLITKDEFVNYIMSDQEEYKGNK
jgi:hypothetical protein